MTGESVCKSRVQWPDYQARLAVCNLKTVSFLHAMHSNQLVYLSLALLLSFGPVSQGYVFPRDACFPTHIYH